MPDLSARLECPDESNPRRADVRAIPRYRMDMTSKEATEHSYTTEKTAYLKRLRRVEGQIRGIARMVEEDEYCIDILTQVSAATSALESVALRLLEDHLKHCVVNAAAEGGPVADAKLAEASAAIKRLVRS